MYRLGHSLGPDTESSNTGSVGNGAFARRAGIGYSTGLLNDRLPIPVAGDQFLGRENVADRGSARYFSVFAF
jgi:hypothetical protein